MYEDILKINNKSIFIADIKKNSDIVIGVPHHTPSGTTNMPCESHSRGDENTGHIGSYIAKELKGSFLCACNYFIDPNKNYNSNFSDYYLALKRCNPKYLIEIHGHGLKPEWNDIEVSSGSKEDEHYSIELKDEIYKLIDKEIEKNKDNYEFLKLKDIKINADFNDIYFKATKSSTIVDKNWISYHIELPLMLRTDLEDSNLPELGKCFTKILCGAIKNCIYS